ncbi:ATP-binding protein [Trujillonella endophytica]|uniref:histidine kinase n=1 Tax=Trujillonella endophytica TaxID=673521 RepID=A0A1H8UG80_9ACTN|nr:ATP-binding protein [Trujillella endophytica]SEP01903.1 Signal transduction histidine kinase [Trujillella endophytica]
MGVEGPSVSAGTDLFSGNSSTGRLMAALDWSHTPIGPVAGWPASLRFAVRTVLASRFPMILTWGAEYTQIYNDAYAELIGAKHPGAIGDDLRVTLAEGWSALQGPVEHAIATREPSWIPQLLLPLERAGYREEAYFTVSHAPAFGDDGEVAGMHAVCTEVTRQVLAERRQDLLRRVAGARGPLDDDAAAVRAMCAAIAADPADVPFAAAWLAGADGGLGLVASCGCDEPGLPARAGSVAELAGLPVPPLAVRGGPLGDPVTEAVLLPLTGGAGGDLVGALLVGVNPNRALDAEYRSFHELLAGQVAAAVVDARAYAAERSRAEALAELDRAKTAFFSDVSHELRTPVTLLLGPIADVLADSGDRLPEDVRERLSLAQRNGQRLRRLVDDLLEFASIEAGRSTAVRVATDVAALTAELAGVLRAAAERAGLRLTVDCPPLPRTAHVDPRMWEKIVLNLVGNAVKYTFVGGIAVALRGEDDRWTLRVSDTGVGIPADELPQVFERFHRGADRRARSREGTGLGLALVAELVDLHGGSVTVTSEPGAGSTFTVDLPYGEPDAGSPGTTTPSDAATPAALTPWVEVPVASAAPEPHPAGDTRTSVLVVDDNADMRAYLTRLLAPHHAVRTARDGQEALEEIGRGHPDLVLTDVMMPVVDGFDLLRALRGDEATRGIPVVMLTARAGQEAAVEGLEAGADDYLPKPFESAELLARVRAVLDRTAGGGAGTRHEPAGSPPPPVDTVPVPTTAPRPRDPLTPRATSPAAAAHSQRWRLPSTGASIPALRRRLRALFADAGLDEDLAYDLLLAACEAATNAVEHAQEPSEPFVDVTVEVGPDEVVVAVRDHGHWRERVPSMDRGRGSMLMSAFAAVTATPSAEGTTVVIRAPRA